MPPDVEADPWIETFHNAQAAGIATACVGQIPIIVAWLVLIIQSSSEAVSFELAIGTVFWSVVGLAYGSVPLGLMCAYCAHRIFRSSTISVGWMTLAFVVIVDLTVLGWILVLLATSTYPL